MDNFLGSGVTIAEGEVVVRRPLPGGISLQMVAVRDIGQTAAAILLGGTSAEDSSIEIAGDSLMAAAISEHLGLPARYEAIPLEAIADNADLAAMFRWFAETPAYQADFDGTHALVPDVLDFRGWLDAMHWQPTDGA